MDCTICKGTKKVTITVKSYLTNAPFKSEKMELDCVHCDGTGIMTQEDIDNLEWMRAQWCSCSPPYLKATYVPDNVSKTCSKHHWVCNQCNLITQIG